MAHQPAFAPIANIKEALHAFHVTAHDRNQVTSAYHYCACLPAKATSKGHATPAHGMRQCLLYADKSPDAKLIGVEFLIEQEDFEALDADEKRYWHSHHHEIESGLLCALAVGGVMGAAAGAASAVAVHSSGGMLDSMERPYLEHVYKMYGKIFHFYNDPSTEAIPLGPPTLMMSTTRAHPSLTAPTSPFHKLVEERDAELGVNTARKAAERAQWLPEFCAQVNADKGKNGQPGVGGREPAAGSDLWEKTAFLQRLQINPSKVNNSLVDPFPDLPDFPTVGPASSRRSERSTSLSWSLSGSDGPKRTRKQQLGLPQLALPEGPPAGLQKRQGAFVVQALTKSDVQTSNFPKCGF
ncbi:unnamed protein product [Tilletia caries]|nr:unnamed protein product [Tilletia caries]